MRLIKDISKKEWHLWLDESASWEDDTLYPPSIADIDNLPVNLPTVGWCELYNQQSKTISLPASVEEHFSDGVNDWQYHGVSWFCTKIDIPEEYRGRRVSLYFEKTRFRAEIFVNQKLAGYDVVSETPYDIDVSQYLQYGQSNDIAIRICNAGGTRGWNDILSYQWGDIELMPSHDFSIVGHVSLVVTDSTYIEDVFVKNLQPALSNNVEIITSIMADTDCSADILLEIIDPVSQQVLYSETMAATLSTGGNILNHNATVADAKPWDLETPNLYNCHISLKTKNANDNVVQRFGFRVMEVIENDKGVAHFYFNGRRFRHKSAIDWGFYAYTGAYATDAMAEKSVRAAKDIGHNGINFHRQIGEPLVMDKADELGLYLYEEPGGIKSGDLTWLARLSRAMFDSDSRDEKVFVIEKNPLAMELIKEKLTRMILRDRNHPSILFYTHYK